METRFIPIQDKYKMVTIEYMEKEGVGSTVGVVRRGVVTCLKVDLIAVVKCLYKENKKNFESIKIKKEW